MQLHLRITYGSQHSTQSTDHHQGWTLSIKPIQVLSIARYGLAHPLQINEKKKSLKVKYSYFPEFKIIQGNFKHTTSWMACKIIFENYLNIAKKVTDKCLYLYYKNLGLKDSPEVKERSWNAANQSLITSTDSGLLNIGNYPWAYSQEYILSTRCVPKVINK